MINSCSRQILTTGNATSRTTIKEMYFEASETPALLRYYQYIHSILIAPEHGRFKQLSRKMTSNNIKNNHITKSKLTVNDCRL